MTTKTKTHTPGPWRIAGYFTVVEDRVGATMVIANASSLGDDEYSGRSREEQKSNARLIASAPELLEALRESVAIHAATGLNRFDLERFREVIRKAEGC